MTRSSNCAGKHRKLTIQFLNIIDPQYPSGSLYNNLYHKTKIISYNLIAQYV